MRTKNGGFTLVELLVSISILAILGLAIVGFLSVCTNQYRKQSADMDMQMEAQVVQSQLQNMLLNTSRGMWISEDPVTNRYNLALFGYDEVQAKAQKIVISHPLTEEKLLYSKYEFSPGVGGSWELADDCEDVLFGQYVKDFKVYFMDEDGTQLEDVDAGSEIAEIKLVMEFENSGRAYSAEICLEPRNEVLFSNEISVLFADEI